LNALKNAALTAMCCWRQPSIVVFPAYECVSTITELSENLSLWVLDKGVFCQHYSTFHSFYELKTQA